MFGRFQEFEPQMQTVHSLNELEIIPHSRLKLSSYVHSKSQFTKKKSHIFFIFIILYVGRFYWGFVEGIKVVRPRKWTIMKMWPPGSLHSSPTSQNLPHTIISLILITLSVLDWDLSRLGKAPKTTWDEDGSECGLGSQEYQKKLSKVLTREGKPFSIIILSFNVDFMN